MSVTTTADECLERAQEHIHDALTELNKIVVERCWGHDEFAEWLDKAIGESYRKLLDIRNALEHE